MKLKWFRIGFFVATLIFILYVTLGVFGKVNVNLEAVLFGFSFVVSGVPLALRGVRS